MAVYVDKLLHWGSSDALWQPTSCHLVADSLDELHAFAARLRLERAWFQDKAMPHYDLTAGKRAQAVRLGAVELDVSQMYDLMKKNNWLRMPMENHHG